MQSISCQFPRQHAPGVPSTDLELVMRMTNPEVWRELQGQRIFVTGGTGFMGCWLLEALLWANDQLGLRLNLTVLSRQPDAFRRKAPHLASHAAVSLIQGNVTNLREINGPFDVLIHAATDVAQNQTDPCRTFDDIVSGAKEALELAKRSKVRRFLHISSGAVYGDQPSELSQVPEEYVGAPRTTALHTAYGQGKRIAEWMSRAYAEQAGFELKIARCFAFVGPYLPFDAHFAIGNFIRDALQQSSIRINGDGTPFRSYLYAADMVVWILTILVCGRNQQPYNVGSENQISIAELARTVLQTLNGKEQIVLGAQPVSSRPASRYVPSTARARAELGLQEYTDLTTAIVKTADWARHHGKFQKTPLNYG